MHLKWLKEEANISKFITYIRKKKKKDFNDFFILKKNVILSRNYNHYAGKKMDKSGL